MAESVNVPAVQIVGQLPDGTPIAMDIVPISDGKNAGLIVPSAGAKTDVFATQTGDATPAGVPYGRPQEAVFTATLVATTAATAAVTLYGTNEAGDTTNGLLLGTFDLQTASAGTDKRVGFVSRPFLEVYGVITGTTGTVTSINFDWVG